jgi:hypothetical protein
MIKFQQAMQCLTTQKTAEEIGITIEQYQNIHYAKASILDVLAKEDYELNYISLDVLIRSSDTSIKRYTQGDTEITKVNFGIAKLVKYSHNKKSDLRTYEIINRELVKKIILKTIGVQYEVVK